MKKLQALIFILIISPVYSQYSIQKSCIARIDTIKYNLNLDDKDGLIFMMQEEKLARDVYLTLGTLYKQKMFVNIPQSEQRHMDALKVLFDKYQITDPVADYEVGIFHNEAFRKLFDDLVSKGRNSFQDAMLVGKEIEELDIEDLNKRIKQTDNPDIKIIFSNLIKGSENHLRAFKKHL